MKPKKSSAKVHEVMKAQAKNVPAVLVDDDATHSPKGADLGYQGTDGHFESLDDYTFVGVSSSHWKRFELLGGDRELGECVFTARFFLAARLQRDFPGSEVRSAIHGRRGQISVRVSGVPEGSLANDREFLQGRLDAACDMVAGCLGV